MDREFAAGGLVLKDEKVLLIKATNLKGEQVWTFPKGHLEKGESAEQGALREVQEETGWECEITGDLEMVQYKFMRSGRLVDKKVRWFWMKPIKKVGKPDVVEILAVKWAAPKTAEKLLVYPSDKKLLEQFKAKKA